METLYVGLEGWMANLGPWAIVLCLLLMAIVAVLPIPAEAPALLNGVLFGPLLGSVVTFTGALAGAVLSFELARSLGRPLVARLMSARTLCRVDQTVGRMGWPSLLGARLMPAVAFTALNWGAGLTSVPRARFFWTTAIGIAPGVVLFTSFGSAVPDFIREHPLRVGMVLVALGMIGVRAIHRSRMTAAPSSC